MSTPDLITGDHVAWAEHTQPPVRTKRLTGTVVEVIPGAAELHLWARIRVDQHPGWTTTVRVDRLEVLP